MAILSYLKFKLILGNSLRIRFWDPSGMNIPDHISEIFETIFGLNTLFFDADPDPGYRNLFYPGSGIRDGKNSDQRSGINIPDPQHCFQI